MSRNRVASLAGIILLAAGVSGCDGEGPSAAVAAPDAPQGAGDGEPPEAVTRRLEDLPVNASPDDVSRSEVPGFYEVTYGANVVYITEDGRYLFQGDVYDLRSQQNITEARRGRSRLQALQSVAGKDTMLFAPENPEHTVTVFTDIDCPYCRKFHEQIDAYNAKGIAVRYLAFPRGGPGSQSFRKAESVWCADDPKKALTRAKAGRSVPERSCDAPVRKHYELGRQVGLRGTPFIVTDEGKGIPGYMSPDRLARVLDGDMSALRGR